MKGSVIAVAVAMLALEATATTDFMGFKLTTAADAHAKMRANPHKTPQATVQTQHRFDQAHQSLMAQRARLGLSQVGMGAEAAGPQVRQNYAELNSAAGFTLNLLSGMSYGEGSNSQCYDSMESFIISLDTGTDVLKKMYIPAFWAEAQIQSQDFLSILASTYIQCNFDKLFNTATALFTSEGLS